MNCKHCGGEIEYVHKRTGYRTCLESPAVAEPAEEKPKPYTCAYCGTPMSLDPTQVGISFYKFNCKCHEKSQAGFWRCLKCSRLYPGVRRCPNCEPEEKSQTEKDLEYLRVVIPGSYYEPVLLIQALSRLILKLYEQNQTLGEQFNGMAKVNEQIEKWIAQLQKEVSRKP